MESDFVDDEMYDDPLMTGTGNDRENFKEDPCDIISKSAVKKNLIESGERDCIEAKTL